MLRILIQLKVVLAFNRKCLLHHVLGRSLCSRSGFLLFYMHVLSVIQGLILITNSLSLNYLHIKVAFVWRNAAIIHFGLQRLGLLIIERLVDHFRVI